MYRFLYLHYPVTVATQHANTSITTKNFIIYVPVNKYHIYLFEYIDQVSSLPVRHSIFDINYWVSYMAVISI